ncbi:hypothetical protein A8B78_10790 [Jannaschia sp. EhC01]|nr:hypothetical protein A8B78_10790 [Jannaschia sp. EhC01]
MNTGLPLLAIGLIFGGGIGFTIAAANGITLDGHDHSAHGIAGHGDADHGALLSLEPSATAPTLAITVGADPLTGYNLHILTENFTFSPQNASLAHAEGEGHAHVYINGVKLGRFYGPWVHLDGLPDGDVIVEVTLNANDHRELAVGDVPLRASVTIQN